MLLSSLFGRSKTPGSWHTNPDTSRGGFVPHDAQVSPKAFVGRTAVIMSGAQIGPEERIESGEIALPNGQVVRFGSIATRSLSI